jgi:hypothetical protein
MKTLSGVLTAAMFAIGSIGCVRAEDEPSSDTTSGRPVDPQYDATRSITQPASFATNGPDPSHFDVRGSLMFTAAEIAEALDYDIELAHAIQTHAARTALLNLSVAKVASGYQCAGFPDVRVNAEFDAESNRIVLFINEGRRSGRRDSSDWCKGHRCRLARC